MPLDPVLARIPGLAGYQAMEEVSRGRESQDLQNLGMAARLQDHFREQKFREGLSPDMSSDDVLKRAYQYLGPEKAATLAQAHQDKEAQRALTGQIARQRIDNQYAMFSQKLPLIANAEQRKQAQLQLDAWYKDARIKAAAGRAEYELPVDIFSHTMGAVGPAPSVVPTAPAPQGAMPERLPPNVPESDRSAYQAALDGGSGTVNRVMPASETAGMKIMGGESSPAPQPPAPLPAGAPAVVQTPGGAVPISRAEQARRERTNQLPPLTGDDLKSAGAQHAAGQPLTQIAPGFGRNLGDRREEIRKEAIRQIMEENPRMTVSQAGQELVNRGIAKVASQKSVSQLEAMKGATIQAVDQLDYNVDRVTKAMDKLGGGGIKDLSPIFTAIARGEQKWTGEPAYAELFYFMHAAAMESARILQGGQASIAQLHQGAAEEAKKWADANWTTPKQWKEGVAPAMKDEAKVRIVTYDSAIKRQRLGGGGSSGEPPTTATPAPQQAISFLRANPTVAMKEAFKKKYGYLPDGL